jgi:hypothetical protein
MNCLKELPRGSWVTINSLTLGTTEQDMQGYLAEAGIAVDLACIAVTQNQKGAQAIISLGKPQVTNLLHRAVGDIKLNGRTPHVVYPKCQDADQRF